MESAIFACPAAWKPLLPIDVKIVSGAAALAERSWDLVALTPDGLRMAEAIRCRLLLAPGECGVLSQIQAERVVTYGLSPRDSLTLSSLQEPVLCVQRTLPRLDGGVIEPQELPLSYLPFPAEELLPLLGLRLLQMPLETAGKL